MTPQHARTLLRIFGAVLVVFKFGLIALVIYALVHPVRHRVLLVILATVICPVLLTILLRKAAIRGLFEQNPAIAKIPLKALLRRNPTVLILVPLMITVAAWASLLMTIGVRQDSDIRDWLKNHTVLTIMFVMTPQIVVACLLVVLHATYTAMYVAGCIVYGTVSVAIACLKLENGVVRFFGTYKAQASPLVILSLASLCAMSFGVLHFAVWSMWPSEYLNMHGIEDAMYFSVVTLATVGYGDILPLGHAARWLCVSKILSGVLLLVVGVSASMTIWLQANQPVSENSRNISKDTLAVEANGGSKPAEPGDGQRNWFGDATHARHAGHRAGIRWGQGPGIA
jgi:voltage-gated potassium channel